MGNKNTKVQYAFKIMEHLEAEKIRTWFDIGYFLDNLKKTRALRESNISKRDDFYSKLKKGVVFITFSLGFDGVTIEMKKYASAISNLLGGKTPIHWLAGDVDQQTEKDEPRMTIFPLMNGFEKSGQVYESLYHTKLCRGDDLYNALPTKIWSDALSLCRDILEYIEKNNIELILAANVASNPGNMSLTLALVMVSKLYDIPVISSNHDFYWEGGSDRKNGERPGPRDHFFKNSDIGEIFSLIQILYPWDSPNWIHANINTRQTKEVIEKLGLNPFNVTETTSSIDTAKFRLFSSEEKESIICKLNDWIGKQAKIIRSDSDDFLETFSDETPVIISNSSKPLSFSKNDLIFLQPTRIIERKQIEKDFFVIRELVKKSSLGKSESIVLLIAGPISGGSGPYARKLLVYIKSLFRAIKRSGKNVHIIFTHGTEHSVVGKGISGKLAMNELYGIASLVFLPSRIETRGLPILESLSSGVPLVVNKFDPNDVYDEVLGKHLKPEKQLKVLELPKGKIGSDFINLLVEILSDQNRKKSMIEHNQRLIQDRYSMKSLVADFARILDKIWLINRDHKKHLEIAKDALAYVSPSKESKKENNNQLIYDNNRVYTQGIMKYRFLSQIRSIIDPSYFRFEEKQTMSEIYGYAKKKNLDNVPEERLELFYNSIRAMFSVTNGKYDIEFDTTFDYRYRCNTVYIWRELTESKLFGAITYIYNRIFDDGRSKIDVNEFLSRAAAIMDDEDIVKCMECHQAQSLALGIGLKDYFLEGEKGKISIIKELEMLMQICDWKIFSKRVLKRPQEIVIFPGNYEDFIWDLFVYDRIVKNWEKKNKPFLLSFVCREKYFNANITINDFDKILKSGIYPHLYSAYRKKMIKIVQMESKGSSVDLKQVSPELQKVLLSAKKNGGHVMSKGEYNYFALDLLDIPSFRFGTIQSLRSRAVFGMSWGTRFFQFVPAGLRTFFGFPLTVETPLQFSKAINSVYDFYDAKETDRILYEYKDYLDKHGMSLSNLINVLNKNTGKELVRVKRLAGKYDENNAWTGVSVTFYSNQNKHSYHILSSRGKKTIPQFVKMLVLRIKRRVVMGWNGGYILNDELVGKLNLPEDYVGLPLGFVVSKGKVLSLPLYNRPIFVIKKDGRIMIDTLRLNFSGSVFYGKRMLFEWKKQYINQIKPVFNKVAVYTPLSGLKKIPSSGRILILIGGRKILKIIYPTDQSTEEELFSAGVTFSLPFSMKDQLAGICENMEVNFNLDFPPQWKDVHEAVGAGPQLIRDGKIAIDLEKEGWLLDHSISTQAARLDRENQRGPKIGCGINKEGDVICVVIESRIRESVGATYLEIAEVLKGEGVKVAMGFDPGGSATLWADGVTNIVPYTNTCNKNPLTGKSHPRPVGNAVLIAIKDEQQRNIRKYRKSNMQKCIGIVVDMWKKTFFRKNGEKL